MSKSWSSNHSRNELALKKSMIQKFGERTTWSNKPTSETIHRRARTTRARRIDEHRRSAGCWRPPKWTAARRRSEQQTPRRIQDFAPCPGEERGDQGARQRTRGEAPRSNRWRAIGRRLPGAAISSAEVTRTRGDPFGEPSRRHTKADPPPRDGSVNPKDDRLRVYCKITNIIIMETCK